MDDLFGDNTAAPPATNAAPEMLDEEYESVLFVARYLRRAINPRRRRLSAHRTKENPTCIACQREPRLRGTKLEIG